MANWLDFFNIYIMGSLQLLIGFHFFTKCLSAKGRPIHHVLFSLFGIIALVFVPANTLLPFATFVLLLVAAGILVCKAEWAGGLFTSVIVYAVVIVEIMQLCYGIFNSILCILYPLAVSFSQKISCQPPNGLALPDATRLPNAFPSSATLYLQIIGIAFMILGSLSLPVSILCYRIVYKYFSFDKPIQRYSLLLLVPTLMIFFLGGYINSTVYGNTITTDGAGNVISLLDNGNAMHVQMLVIQLLGLASLFCVMYAYKKLTESFYLKTRLALLEQESHSLRQYVDEAKMRYEKTTAFRHDVKNHVTVIRELLRNQKTEEALNYVSDMEALTADLSFPCSTNHPVLDILLGNKLGVAKEEGIDVSCTLRLPYPCSIKDMDLCIILANALDNAICACREMHRPGRADASHPTRYTQGHPLTHAPAGRANASRSSKYTQGHPLTHAPAGRADASHPTRYIHVGGNVQGDFILLEIENSFRGNALHLQGTGLSNIKAIAEKYHGTMEIKTTETSFELNVLLILPQKT